MKTILIVDDEFDLTRTLQAVLQGEGYHAETCWNGREALDRLRADKPDLILMDIMLPKLSGLEVLQEMRREPDLDGIPVALMSAVSPEVKRSGYRWEAFLRKPFPLELLLKTVEQLVGKANQGV